MSNSADSAWRTGIYALSSAERQALALALLARSDRDRAGWDALQRKYPQAPGEMINTAAHHVYVDGPGAVIDYLADAELAIRDPAHQIGYGPASDLLYHVYNWLQFRALLPEGKSGLLDLLSEIEQFARDDDRDALLRSVEQLREVLDGDRSPPEVS